MNPYTDLIETLTADNESMTAILAHHENPHKGYAVLDGSPCVIAKVDDDGSTVGYLNHQLIDGEHRVAMVAAPRACRWSAADCDRIIDREIKTECGHFVTVHWTDSYREQIARNTSLIAALSVMTA